MGWKEMASVVRPLLHLMLPFFIHVTGTVVAFPAVTDIAVAALCPSAGEGCPVPIYASGLSQAVSGIGTIFLTPVMGSLSDDYGRKPLLILCFSLAMIPYGILAFSISRNAVIAFYIARSITGMLSDGTFITLILAFVADVVSQEHRAAAFGITMSSLSVGLMAGTAISRAIPTYYVFQVAVIACAIAALYLVVLLPETLVRHAVVPGRALEAGKEESANTPLLLRNKSQLRDTVTTVRKSPLLFGLALCGFLSNFAESGITSALFFFLKVQFGYEKDQFAELLLILGVASLTSQVLLLPLFVCFIGVRGTLLTGLFFSILHGAFYGAAWASWVPYIAATMAAFTLFIFPSIGSMVSAMGTSEDQGKLQGVVSGLRSLASALAPLIFNPLLAYFVSDAAPFKFPGFGILVATAFGVVALVVGFMLPPLPGNPAVVASPEGYVTLPSEDSDVPVMIVDPILARPPAEEIILS